MAGETLTFTKAEKDTLDQALSAHEASLKRQLGGRQLTTIKEIMEKELAAITPLRKKLQGG